MPCSVTHQTVCSCQSRTRVRNVTPPVRRGKGRLMGLCGEMVVTQKSFLMNGLGSARGTGRLPQGKRVDRVSMRRTSIRTEPFAKHWRADSLDADAFVSPQRSEMVGEACRLPCHVCWTSSAHTCRTTLGRRDMTGRVAVEIQWPAFGTGFRNVAFSSAAALRLGYRFHAKVVESKFSSRSRCPAFASSLTSRALGEPRSTSRRDSEKAAALWSHSRNL